MAYEILEANMDRLHKKLMAIHNKCKKYGCEFHYQIVGETFKELDDGHGHRHTARFLLVEADGAAIVEGWEFAGTMEYAEGGNIFRSPTGIEIPDRYHHMPPVCEHCMTKRNRSHMYIVRNRETGEFKQVGKSCLADFTHGMSASVIARYVSLFEALIQGQAVEPYSVFEHYLDVDGYLRFAAETVRCFGYRKRSEDDEGTAGQALDYYEASHGNAVSRDYLRRLQDQMAAAGFDADRPETAAFVKGAMDWAVSQTEDSGYMRNLKSACRSRFVKYQNAGLLASLVPTYRRAMEMQAGDPFGGQSRSAHIGDVGGRIAVHVTFIRCMASWEDGYGTKRLYKMKDEDGNICIWKTGTAIEEGSAPFDMAATVKAHSEFQGVKQTELTRCRIQRRG